MKEEKIDIEFCLTDDSVNVYGYRLKTSGLQLDRFKPAIGYFMHDREKGVAVRWEDFRIADGKLFARPVVNTASFPELAEQIRCGFYNAASVGHIVAIEMTDDPSSKLEGQTGPTVTKWFPRECSIVDIPGNYNAIAQLYDETDNVLRDLSADLIEYTMDKLELTAEHRTLLNLKGDNLSEHDVTTRLKDLVAKEERLPMVENELNALKASIARDKVEAILAKGLSEHRMTQQLADQLKVDYALNPDGLQTLVDAMPQQATLVSQLDPEVPEKYQGKTFEDLYMSGELEEVKEKYPELYNKLKQEN